MRYKLFSILVALTMSACSAVPTNNQEMRNIVTDLSSRQKNAVGFGRPYHDTVDITRPYEKTVTDVKRYFESCLQGSVETKTYAANGVLTGVYYQDHTPVIILGDELSEFSYHATRRGTKYYGKFPAHGFGFYRVLVDVKRAGKKTAMSIYRYDQDRVYETLVPWAKGVEFTCPNLEKMGGGFFKS